MSTAHEILAEVKAARESADAEDFQSGAQWQKLVARCRSTKHTKLMLLIMSGLTLAWMGLYLVLLLSDSGVSSQSRSLLFPSACLSVSLTSALLFMQQRSAVLVELIQLAAPELYEKLKDEGVL